MSPRVSVIMPVHNGGAYLREAVDSILGQSLADLELLIVDDHSDDEAISGLDIQDSRLRVLTGSGRGVSHAFNTGLGQARGAFVARMDADDIAMPRRLETQLGYLEHHPDVDICGGCVEIFPAQRVGGGNRRYQEWLNACRDPATIRRELFVESPIPNPTTVFRRRAIERLEGYSDPPWPEDYDLFLRADAMGMLMGKPADTVLRWREHDGRLTRTDSRYSIASFQQAKAHYLARGRLAEAGEVVLWGAGPGGRLFHDLLQGEGIKVAGFLEVHPRRIGGEKRGLPVWPIEQVRDLHGSMVLVAVGAAGAREKIRRFMQENHWVEGEAYLFVA